MTDFVCELGTEELPADFVTEALAQWQAIIPSTLQAVDLLPQGMQTYGTPRRLAVYLTNVPAHQPEQRVEVKGPAVAAAYRGGEPTPALLGFLRSRQAQLTDVELRQTPKGEFVYLVQTLPGRPAPELLVQLMPQWWQGLSGRRFMRWGDGTLKFSRPIRWLLALWGEQVLSVTLENGSEHLHSDRVSYGHRVLQPEPVIIPQASMYLDCLRGAGVEPDVRVRQQQIQQELNRVVPARSQVAMPPVLLAEVTQLVERPSGILGEFDPLYLCLPAAVITTVMTQHQRYFPVLNPQGELLPYFATISNGNPEYQTTIKRGNERVLKARLADAQFFYESDLRQPLTAYVPQLKKVTFQEQLGSVFAKVQRIQKLLEKTFLHTNYTEIHLLNIRRTAQLCKADLVTQMVGEFSELQGIMGGHYALKTGESEVVAQAISEHYQDVPTTLTGQWVALADRLDTVVGILAVGLIPTGSSDPFALRRAVRNIILITAAIYPTYPLNLQQIFQEMAAILFESYPQLNREELQHQWHSLVGQRLQAILQEKGLAYDLIHALLNLEEPEILTGICSNIQDFFHRAEKLMQLRANGILQSIYATVNRATRLANQGSLPTSELNLETVIDRQYLQQPIEQELYHTITELLIQTQATKNTGDYGHLIQGLKQIAPILERFFDGSESVLVMDDDLNIRQNRLNLLGLIRNSALVLADFSQIVKN